MNFTNYLSFVAITFMITYSPGPMTMFLMNNGIQQGLSKTLPALYGASTAYILSIIIYAFGISKLLREHQFFLYFIQYLGALYMLYLAYKKIEYNRQLKREIMLGNNLESNIAANFHSQTASNKLALYRGGLLTGLSNPKAILLFSVIFPRFLLQSQHLAIDCTILGSTFLLLQFSSGCCYTYFGQQLKQFLLSYKNQQLINNIIAVIFLIVAVLFVLVNIN